MNILIAVPTFETIFPDTFKSIWDLDKGGHNVAFEFVRGYDCATARNKIVQKALDMDVDYVLMVDNDVVLPADALVNLLEDARPVQLGYYAHRGDDNLFDGRVCINKLGEYNYTAEFMYTVEEMRTARERGEYKIRIHGGGMGCALIHTDVFEQTEYPWYDWVNYANKEHSMLTEDLFFCERCRMARIPIYTDSRVGCGHMLRHVQQVI